MKMLSRLGLSAVLLMISSNSFASALASQCPQGLEGNWICPNFDLASESNVSIIAVKSGDKIRLYRIGGADWSLSGRWAPLMSTNERGVNGTLWEKNRCQAGILITDNKFKDLKGHPIGSVHSSAIKMDNINQFSILNSDNNSVNGVCYRKL